MSKSNIPAANRILIIDDNRAIHADFRKILVPQTASDAVLRKAEALVFGAAGRHQRRFRGDLPDRFRHPGTGGIANGRAGGQ